MKIEYISNGSPDCPLVQISETSKDDIQKLLTAWEKLSERAGETIELKNNNLQLICKSGKKDIGLKQITNDTFECILGCETWLQVHGLTEPFLKSQTGFQWLSVEGPIKLLLSPHGGW